MKATITLELDMDSYNRKYGPGSAWAEKYGHDMVTGRSPDWLKEALEEVLSEGFYDWDSEGWLKVQVQQS